MNWKNSFPLFLPVLEELMWLTLAWKTPLGQWLNQQLNEPSFLLFFWGFFCSQPGVPVTVHHVSSWFRRVATSVGWLFESLNRCKIVGSVCAASQNPELEPSGCTVTAPSKYIVAQFYTVTHGKQFCETFLLLTRFRPLFSSTPPSTGLSSNSVQEVRLALRR